MSDLVKHRGPWLPGMMVVDRGRSRRGRVHSVLKLGSPTDMSLLICHSASDARKWTVEVGCDEYADLSDESTRRLMDSLKADGGAS